MYIYNINLFDYYACCIIFYINSNLKLFNYNFTPKYDIKY